MMNTESAAAAVGASFRQVDYWIRVGIIAPSGQPTINYHNGAPARRWTSGDIARLRVVAQIMARGEGGERSNGCTDTAKLVMKHWRRGPGWLVLSPLTSKGALVLRPEKVPKAVRQVGGRCLVVPLP